MNFAEAAKINSSETRTENGAYARNTSGDASLDLFSTIGSLREANENRVESLFAGAFAEDSLLATRIAFYGRDVRGGLGERETFRVILRYMANHCPKALRPNLDLIGVYGRYDDLYTLIGTPLEKDMWKVMKAQFEEDWANYQQGNAVSLLGKWIKNGNSKNEKTRKLGIETAKHLGYSVYDFKRMVAKLRAHIGVVESLMSTGRWAEIKYSAVPSRAMKMYKNAFLRRDGERFSEFINNVVEGTEKINSSTLYPYDIIEEVCTKLLPSLEYLWIREGMPVPFYMEHLDVSKRVIDENSVEYKTLQAQWDALPNYVDGETNVLVMADTSGSMEGRPLWSALGLAIYFAQRNKGAFHNLWMNFSTDCHFNTLKGNTLAQNILGMDMHDWMGSTNLEKAFKEVLALAVENDIPAEEMPKSIVVVSDMEIDRADYNENWLFYDNIKEQFEEKGYEIPNIVFWNVNSRSDVFHADANRKGVQLCSGQSPITFKHLVESLGLTPKEFMFKVINSERYEPISVES